MRKVVFLILSIMFIFPALAREPVEYVQELQEPANWWEGDVLLAVGYGTPPENVSYNQARSFAKRSAILDAYRNLAAQAGNIRITKEQTLMKAQVSALLSGAEIISQDYDDDGKCTVVLKIPIYGVKNSVAKIAFKPVEKENFLPPAEEVTTEGHYTGLIVDCGEMELEPVLAPTIRDEHNQSIYGYSNLDYEKVISNGMIGYKSSKSPVFVGLKVGKVAYAEQNTSRAGDNPLIIKAVNVGDDNTCPIISAQDSDKILAENGVSHFLDEGAVVFTSNRIRGVRM